MTKKLSYIEARTLIRENFVSSALEYQEFRNSCEALRSQLPSQPLVFYKEDWKGWDEFTGVKHKELDIDIKTLQTLAEHLNLHTRSEWEQAIKENMLGVPISINKIKGFSNWSNFLSKSEYISFKELLVFTRSLSIKTQMDWREWCKKNSRPDRVPFNLRKIYYDDYLAECLNHNVSFWKFIFVGED
ncbi:hypothetical protein [Shewanella aestuarii]|uniref:Uncharacterized protein n=1 Tax=Shewanella aestuarii TaxID=1028752 RepID=A0A6G9QPD3_9GAMM|nr:hypothetical protein [Shewanella aestuarii]QIR16426.1 hypothetical protein HBH39_18310 [Shewanella aestuarii]